jgi:hypothetical protein
MFKKTIIITGLLLALSVAGTAFAVTSTDTAASVATKISCVGKAVSTREATLDAGMATYTKALNDAYSARAAALATAYSQTTTAQVKAGVKAAWSGFNSSVKAARKAWQTTRNSAWALYRKDAVACRAPAGTGDGANSVSETSGN